MPTDIVVLIQKPLGDAGFQTLGRVSAFNEPVRYSPLIKAISRRTLSMLHMLEPRGWIHIARNQSQLQLEEFKQRLARVIAEEPEEESEYTNVPIVPGPGDEDED